MSTRRFLGELDAAEDRQLEQHFVSQDELSVLVRPESHIVFGAKGVGKTALRRALTELRPDAFLGAGTIDLDNLNFQRVHAELEKIGASNGEDPTSLARVTWKNVLSYYCLEVAREHVGDSSIIHEIDGLLSKEQTAVNVSSNRLLNLLLRFGQMPFEKVSGNAVERPSTRRTSARSFPPLRELGDLLGRVSGIISSLGKKIVVCVDGFDSIVEHNAESRKAVFAGLIDAIFRLSRDAAISSAFCFKAFLPKELTYEAKAVVWDADKHLDKLRTLHWSEESLKEFIARRLAQHGRTQRKGEAFDSIWNEFMPTSVRNSVHDEEEGSFNYILRHTQFRPRQLLFQVQAILDGWDSRSNAFRVDASFLPKVVSQTNRLLADATVRQLEFSRAGVEGFLRSWGGSSSTIPFADCFSKIKRLFGVEESIQARQIFDELYEFGVLGVSRRLESDRKAKILHTRFSYVGDGVLTRIQPQDNDIIVMCPMFSDYFACGKSVHGIVSPVAA